MRKWVVGSLAVALLLFGGLFALLMPWPCPVNRAAFDRVKEGMTQEEVHGILGGPPGDYRTLPPGPYGTQRFGWDGNCPIEEWLGDEITVLVLYECSGPVDSTFSIDLRSSSPGLLELARWRLERLKERLLP
jgi:hypothetical protein